MATIIKLQRRGTIHRPFWWIVVTDDRKPKGCIEQLGTYSNLRKPVQIDLNQEKAAWWILRGASPSQSVRRIFQNQGVFQRAAEMKVVGKSA